MAVDILQRIVARRRERLAGNGPGDGATQGLDLPGPGLSVGDGGRPDPPTRVFPTPVICEIKRRSPSRGDFARDLDPVEQARVYTKGGARAVSILTEQDHFGGSLADLVAVRRAYPDLAILRKDFLLTREDIEVSRRAGADAVLLIAAILEPDHLAAMHAAAQDLGLVALVEVHNREELELVRELKPPLLGVNSRDLRSFRVDLLVPAEVAMGVDWPATLVFESGIFFREDAHVARDSGFSAVLVGEAVMRNPERIPELTRAMSESGTGFWPWCASRRTGSGGGAGPGPASAGPPRPLVKICGITNREDALLAEQLGADMLGLVYANSPRQAPAGLARELSQVVSIPLVAVVVEPVEPSKADFLLDRARRDLAAGYVAALQLHGAAEPDRALDFGWPYYKAVRPDSPESARDLVRTSRSVRLLVDAYHKQLAGGTGMPVSEDILTAVREALAARPHGELWLAGGLGPDTIAAVIERWRPELVDASSRLEASPGRKDPDLMRAFFAALPPLPPLPPGLGLGLPPQDPRAPRPRFDLQAARSADSDRDTGKRRLNDAE